MMEPTSQGNEPKRTSTVANDTFRIHDLPPETLIHALLCLRDVDPPARDLTSDDHTQKTRLGWITATHVSQFWRDAILACPLFWTQIPFHLGQSWVAALMSRCQSMPIDISLDENKPASWIDVFMSENFYRTRSLRIGYWMGAQRRDDPIYALLERSSAALQVLSFDRAWRRLEHPRLRTLQYPQLRTLHISLNTMYAEDFPWRDIGPTGLKSLSITTARPMYIDRVLADLIHCLQRLQALSTFTLDWGGVDDKSGGAASEVHRHRNDAKDTDYEIDHRPVPFIVLPNIKNMTLVTHAKEAIRILHHISLSPSTLVTLSLFGVLERGPFSSTLQPLISTQTTIEPYRDIILHGGYGNGNGMHLSAASSIARTSDSNHAPHHAARLRVVLSPTIDFFPDILSALGFDNVFRFSVHSGVELSLRSDIMLPCITTLFQNVTCVSCTVMPFVTNYSRDITSAGILAATLRRLLLPTDPTGHCPFPKLAALDLMCADVSVIVSRCMHPDDVKSKFNMPPTFAQTLTDVMSARRKTGVRMPRVYLQEFKGPGTRFETSMLDIVLAIPEVEFLPDGSQIVVDENTGEVRIS